MTSRGPSLTPGTEPLPGAPLVTTGAYGHVRHPIYSGVVLVLAGYTLAWSNWTLALIVGVVARQFFEAKARAEERWLVERYPGYARYCLRAGGGCCDGRTEGRKDGKAERMEGRKGGTSHPSGTVIPSEAKE